MAEIELAIKIDKELYKGIKRRDGSLETEYVCDELMKAIDNGIPLPEGKILWSKNLIKDDACNEIEQLPPVIPIQKKKTGKWIDDYKNEIDDEHECNKHFYRCSECGKYADQFVDGIEDLWDTEKPNFCPNCGARMVSE